MYTWSIFVIVRTQVCLLRWMPCATGEPSGPKHLQPAHGEEGGGQRGEQFETNSTHFGACGTMALAWLRALESFLFHGGLSMLL